MNTTSRPPKTQKHKKKLKPAYKEYPFHPTFTSLCFQFKPIVNESEDLYTGGGKSYRRGIQNFIGAAPLSNTMALYNGGKAISLSIFSMSHSTKI